MPFATRRHAHCRHPRRAKPHDPRTRNNQPPLPLAGEGCGEGKSVRRRTLSLRIRARCARTPRPNPSPARGEGLKAHGHELAPLHAPCRPRAAGHHARSSVRQRRRAHQRHRQRAVSQADQGRPLRRSGRRRAPAGRERRADPRRQHGRRPDRFRGRDDAVSQPDRVRARHRARARDGRFVEMERDRSGPQVPAGQGRRQLDLAQGRRGCLHRARAQGAALWRGRGRDGVRRAGPGRHVRAQGRDLHARVPHPDRRGRLSARRHHLRSEHLRDRDRHRGARQLRRRLHRGDAHHQGDAAALPYLRRRLERLVLVPRQQQRARGDPRRVPLPRDPRRHGHGHRQRRRAADLRRSRERTCASASRMSCSTGARTRRNGCSRWRSATRRERRTGGERKSMARVAGAGAPRARARARHRCVRRARHRRSAPAQHAAARRDRRPADGRHERRWRSVRRRARCSCRRWSSRRA